MQQVLGNLNLDALARRLGYIEPSPTSVKLRGMEEYTFVAEAVTPKALPVAKVQAQLRNTLTDLWGREAPQTQPVIID